MKGVLFFCLKEYKNIDWSLNIKYVNIMSLISLKNILDVTYNIYDLYYIFIYIYVYILDCQLPVM